MTSIVGKFGNNQPPLVENTYLYIRKEQQRVLCCLMVKILQLFTKMWRYNSTQHKHVTTNVASFATKKTTNKQPQHHQNTYMMFLKHKHCAR